MAFQIKKKRLFKTFSYKKIAKTLFLKTSKKFLKTVKRSLKIIKKNSIS